MVGLAASTGSPRRAAMIIARFCPATRCWPGPSPKAAEALSELGHVEPLRRAFRHVLVGAVLVQVDEGLAAPPDRRTVEDVAPVHRAGERLRLGRADCRSRARGRRAMSPRAAREASIARGSRSPVMLPAAKTPSGRSRGWKVWGARAVRKPRAHRGEGPDPRLPPRVGDEQVAALPARSPPPRTPAARTRSRAPRPSRATPPSLAGGGSRGPPTPRRAPGPAARPRARPRTARTRTPRSARSTAASSPRSSPTLKTARRPGATAWMRASRHAAPACMTPGRSLWLNTSGRSMQPAATTTFRARHSQWHSSKGSPSAPTVNPVTRFSPQTPVTGDLVKTRTPSAPLTPRGQRLRPPEERRPLELPHPPRKVPAQPRPPLEEADAQTALGSGQRRSHPRRTTPHHRHVGVEVALRADPGLGAGGEAGPGRAGRVGGGRRAVGGIQHPPSPPSAAARSERAATAGTGDGRADSRTPPASGGRRRRGRRRDRSGGRPGRSGPAPTSRPGVRSSPRTRSAPRRSPSACSPTRRPCCTARAGGGT